MKRARSNPFSGHHHVGNQEIECRPSSLAGPSLALMVGGDAIAFAAKKARHMSRMRRGRPSTSTDAGSVVGRRSGVRTVSAARLAALVGCAGNPLGHDHSRGFLAAAAEDSFPSPCRDRHDRTSRAGTFATVSTPAGSISAWRRLMRVGPCKALLVAHQRLTLSPCVKHRRLPPFVFCCRVFCTKPSSTLL